LLSFDFAQDERREYNMVLIDSQEKYACKISKESTSLERFIIALSYQQKEPR